MNRDTRLALVRTRLASLARAVEAGASHAGEVAGLAEQFAAVLRAGGTLYFAGNGGSAADAQHLATEYAVRYTRSRPALAARALTTDTSLLTAAGNDFGFDQIFARQVEAYCRPGDVLILHSTSGQSRNLLEAARAARNRQVQVVAFLGKGGGELAGLANRAVVIASSDTSEIQVLHLALEHLIVELVESELFASVKA
jgi:D-sedoheptulose 7-phosphate isomerase